MNLLKLFSQRVVCKCRVGALFNALIWLISSAHINDQNQPSPLFSPPPPLVSFPSTSAYVFSASFSLFDSSFLIPPHPLPIGMWLFMSFPSCPSLSVLTPGEFIIFPTAPKIPGCCQLCMRAQSLQPCLTLCDPLAWSPPGSSVHGILQARTLEWAAIPSSSGSCQLRDRTRVFCDCRQILYPWATGEALLSVRCLQFNFPRLTSSSTQLPILLCIPCFPQSSSGYLGTRLKNYFCFTPTIISLFAYLMWNRIPQTVFEMPLGMNWFL